MAWTDPRLFPLAGIRAAFRTITAAVAVLAAGCSTVPRESPLPHDGPTMMDVYRGHVDQDGEDGALSARNRIPTRDVDADREVAQRRALSEAMNNRFERLPNPDLVMTVFPHIAPGKYPVPGYQTVFPMYDGVQYAMPGEVAPRNQAASSFTYPAPTTGQLPRSTASSLDAQEAARRNERLQVAQAMSPAFGQALRAYDRLYRDHCGATLTANQLGAVVRGDSPVLRELFTQASAGHIDTATLAASRQFPCDLPAVASAASPSSLGER